MTSPDFRRDSAMQPADPVRALQVARVTDFADATREMQEMRQLVEQLAGASKALLAVAKEMQFSDDPTTRRGEAVMNARAALRAYAAWSGK